jgi:hypothetical protein
MVDPSVGITMDGGANRVCVGDHAVTPRSARPAKPSETGPQPERAQATVRLEAAQYYNFKLLVSIVATWECHTLFVKAGRE